MLKIKEQLNYRRGTTWAKCKNCDHYVPEFKRVGIGGNNLGIQPRCKMIGLKPGRMYNISPNSMCDAYTIDEWKKKQGVK